MKCKPSHRMLFIYIIQLWSEVIPTVVSWLKLNNNTGGSKGSDFVKGIDGVDMYIIRKANDVDTLDNFCC